MRETQTTPKQPRDEDGNVPEEARARPAEHEQPEVNDADRIDGRDRPPAGSDRGPSPWLGGG
jgi:hypothetical protein